MTESEFTKILDWPGYRVYRHEIDERTRNLRLWVRRKRGNRVLICSGCGGFVKFDALEGEMTILERASTQRGPGHRLFKSLDNQIVLEVAGNSSQRKSVNSTRSVIAGAWGHYAVVSNGGELGMYINGTLMGSVPVPKLPNVFKEWWGDVCVGATHQSRARLTGRVDELAFYNRAMDAAEIKTIYQLSTAGPCRQ